MNHHPAEELLIDYASGTLPEAAALLLATHLSLCPGCRKTVRLAESVGGALLREGDGQGELAVPIQLPTIDAPRVARTTPATSSRIPRPLRDYLGADSFDDVRWRTMSFGVRHFPIKGVAGGDAMLLAIRGGMGLPVHTHKGSELTMVLAGGFSDSTGAYGVGDVEMADPSLTHQPMADADETCICLAVIDAPLVFTGRIARIVNRLFLR